MNIPSFCVPSIMMEAAGSNLTNAQAVCFLSQNPGALLPLLSAWHGDTVGSACTSQ